MIMDIRKIRYLAKMLHQEGISEMELQEGEFYLRLTRAESNGETGMEPVRHEPSGPERKEEPPDVPHNAKVISSPLSGTFYRSKSPGAPPLVNIGDDIQKGKTLCILEAMKLMNELEAPEDGKIIEILVENTKPVQEGQPLFRYVPA
jgi:acetyl-CoA carboxylase biotin carboxyl carrier protein